MLLSAAHETQLKKLPTLSGCNATQPALLKYSADGAQSICKEQHISKALGDPKNLTDRAPPRQYRLTSAQTGA